MQKAKSLAEIDYVVDFNIPVSPGHPFFVDFSDVRGDFEEKVIYKSLNVNPRTFTYYDKNRRQNRNILFIGGMRGSGKTTELAKFASKLNNPKCFLCVTCNIDTDLNMNDVEYMDILIFQIEKLLETAKDIGLLLNDDIIKTLSEWFNQTIKEINNSLKASGSNELTFKAGAGILGFLNIANTLKAAISGSKESSTTIRNTLKNNFSEFAKKFNEFIGEVKEEIREKSIARDILFIVDGLEKAASVEIRRKIILDESNRLQQILANTIFTLPIELMKKQEYLKQFSTAVISFPFVKILDKNSEIIPNAVERFKEFVYKRIEASLFEDEKTVEKAIIFSGGSPRELLRILQMACYYADEEKGKIDLEALDKGIKKLAQQTGRFITEEEFEKLKLIKENITNGKETPFDDVIQNLIEKMIVFEYNDGTYKRVNPVMEQSSLYKQYVEDV